MRTPAKPFPPTPLPEPCPKCAGVVLLQQWQGLFQARCQGPECRFGFDADKRGRGLGHCPACAGGLLKSTPKGRVCAHCGRWDNAVEPGGRPAHGHCPKCKTGHLSIIKGEYGYFVGCSDLVCGLTYTCDETGRPEGGRCKACRGPVRKTRSGARICVACETWQEPRRMGPAEARACRPELAPCGQCGQPLRLVLTRRNAWIGRCDACALWVQPPAAGPMESTDP